jgi:hypothetical protein
MVYLADTGAVEYCANEAALKRFWPWPIRRWEGADIAFRDGVYLTDKHPALLMLWADGEHRQVLGGYDHGFAAPSGRYVLTRAHPSRETHVWELAHPPQWWGHFLRPEVWLALLTGSLLLRQVVRWRRSRKIAHGASVPQPLTSG